MQCFCLILKNMLASVLSCFYSFQIFSTLSIWSISMQENDNVWELEWKRLHLWLISMQKMLYIDKLINLVEGCVCECGTYEMLRKLCNFIVMFSTLQYQLKLYSGNFHFSLCLWLHCIVKKCDVFPELNLVVYELKITDCVNNVLRIILLPWMRASNHQRPSGFWY